MPALPRYFARAPKGVNLHDKRVVVVGVGAVGSPIAEKLARSTVGHLRFIDDDMLETENLARHVLPKEYAGPAWNKAEGLAVYLAEQIEGLQTEAIPRKIDRSVSDRLLDRWLADADLIVAATDDREAQRRIGLRALVLGIPAIFPALFVGGGGEVIVQLDDVWPCFGCWDHFRENTEQLRGASALDFAGEPVIHTSIRLSIGLLDPKSAHREMLMSGRGEPPNQAFLLDGAATLRNGPIRRRPDCPSCAVGPAGANEQQSADPASRIPNVSSPGKAITVSNAAVLGVLALAFMVAPWLIPTTDTPSISVLCGVWRIVSILLLIVLIVVACSTDWTQSGVVPQSRSEASPTGVPRRSVRAFVLYPLAAVVGIAFVAGPWVIMGATGLMEDSNAMGDGFFPGAPIMLICCVWGIASVGSVIAGFVALVSR